MTNLDSIFKSSRAHTRLGGGHGPQAEKKLCPCAHCTRLSNVGRCRSYEYKFAEEQDSVRVFYKQNT